MVNTSIARPYAKAAFETAKESGQLATWSAALRALSVAVEDKAMASVLANPLVRSEQSVELLLSVLDKVGGTASSNSDKHLENFIRILGENKRLSLIPEIADLFEADVAKDEGYLKLTVTSAFPLDDSQQDQVKQKLRTQLDTDVKITYDTDAAIIGGIVVRSDQWVLDDSVRGRLTRLQSVLQ